MGTQKRSSKWHNLVKSETIFLLQDFVIMHAFSAYPREANTPSSPFPPPPTHTQTHIISSGDACLMLYNTLNKIGGEHLPTIEVKGLKQPWIVS